MAEWPIAAVLKTVELQGSGGSNPSLSAFFFIFQGEMTEWPIVPDSKSGVRVTVPGVQIPLSPYKI